MQHLSALLQSVPPLLLVLLKATLLLAAVQLLVAAIPRVSAATRHLLLVTGITGFLLFPLFSLTLPSWDLPLLPGAQAAAMMPAEEDFRFSSNASSFPTNESLTVAARRLDGQRSASVADSPRTVNWMAISIYAWMTVALLLLSRVFLGLVRVWWIIRTSDPVSTHTARLAEQAKRRLMLTRDLRLLASDFVEVPMICGFFRPTVLLPSTTEEWPEDQLGVVLLHEFAHLKRWDALTLLLTNLVTSLFWFHPQLWFASLSARCECERACDDLVLNAGTKPSDYAGHLLSIVKLMPEIERFGAVTLAMSQRSQLEGRLLAILHPSLRRGSVDGRAMTGAILGAALLLLPLATARLTAKETITSDGVLMASLDPQSILETDQEPNPDPAIELAAVDQEDDEDAEDRKDWYSRGYELHHQGRYDQAIAAFLKSIEDGRREEAAMYNIACGYALKNDRDQAIKWLNRSIESGFDSYEHLLEDSDLDSLRSDPRFQTVLARYIKDHEDEEDEDDDVDDVDDGEEEIEDARSELSSLRRNRSTDGEEWHEVGKELLSLRQLDEAIEALTQAVQHLGYQNQSAMYNMACAHALRGNHEEALDWLERSINAGYDDPNNVRRDRDLASLRGTPRYQQLVQLAEDLSLFNHQSKSWKNEPQYSKRRWASTIEFFDSYVRSHPNSGRAWFNLGFALHYSSDHRRAVDAFQQSLRLGYRQPTSMYNIACAYAKLGQSENALEWLERSEQAGFELHNYIFSDEDLESLHDNPRFLAIAARVGAEHGIEKFRNKLRKIKRQST